MKNFILLLCVGLLGVRCGTQTQYRPLSVSDTIPLPGIVLNDSILAQVTVDLRTVGNYLAVAYLDQDQELGHLYTKQGEPLSDFCPQGKGPGEVVVITSLYRNNEQNTLWAFDPQQKKLIQWNIDSLLAGQKAPVVEKSLPPLPMAVTMTKWTAGGTLAIGGNGIISPNKPERFLLLDQDCRPISRYGVYPVSDDTIRMKAAYSLQSFTSISPDGTKMACGLYFGAILETFDIRDSIRLRNTGYFIEPDFPHDELGNPTSYENITFGFGTLCSSDDRIYAAYNGTKDYKRMNFIAVFDWNGKLQKVYKTDFHLIRTSYDPKQHAIFAIVQNEAGEYQLVRFDLPATE